jgi:hypothetical protein
MTTLAYQRIRELSLPPNALLEVETSCVRLKVTHERIEVRLTVPTDVLEWFADATDLETGFRAQDWCDYEGYDDTPNEQLDRDMEEDVMAFVSGLLTSNLRFQASGKKSGRLLWNLDGTWRQAIPLEPRVA